MLKYEIHVMWHLGNDYFDLSCGRVKKPETVDNFCTLVKHRHSVTAVALSEDDLRGFSASKDGTILHWDVSSGKSEKYAWPREDTLRSHGTKDRQGRAKKHSKQVLALAVSSDGRYLTSGGQDRHVHLWDTRTREHIQVIISSSSLLCRNSWFYFGAQITWTSPWGDLVL